MKLFEIKVLCFFEKRNSKNFKKLLIPASMIHDARLLAMPSSYRWLFFGLLTIAGEADNDTITITERQVNDLVTVRERAENALYRLESFQLVKVLTQRPLKERNKEGRKEGKLKTQNFEKENQILENQNPPDKPSELPMNQFNEILLSSKIPKPEELLELWNQRRCELPAAKALSEGRKKSAKLRLKEHPNLEYWAQVIDALAHSDWCNGRHENNKTWKADFDFLLKPETHVKALEGKYTKPPEMQRSMPHRI